MNWTSDQQQVINARDCNLLVSAAAGSGKTAVLVERILQMITDKSHPLDVDELLVVTFTNAAASQMREKISSALYKKQEEYPTDEHLIRQLSLIQHASITTIDSFCLQVVRENFQQLGLDPAFRIGEPAELTHLAEEAMTSVLEQYYEEMQPVFLDFVDCYGNDKSDAAIEQYIKNVAKVADSYPRPYLWIRQAKEALCIENPQQMEEKKWYQHLADGVRNMVRTCIQDAAYTKCICEGVGGPVNFAATCQADINVMQDVLRAEHYTDFQKAFSAKFQRAAAIREGSCDPEKAELVKKMRKKYKDTFFKLNFFDAPIEVVLQEFQVIGGHMNQLLSLTETYMHLLDEKKFSEGLLDFSDVEHYALNVLVDANGPTDIARHYQKIYKEILIDEYQDSNFLQEEILESISGTKGHMFMVGDVKQSIYKFRMARPDLFMDKYQKYEMLCDTTVHKEDCKVDLHNNFRSRAIVLEAVNDIFYQVMGADFGGIDYDENAALVPGFSFPEEKDAYVSSSVELMVLDETSDKTLTKPNAEAVDEAVKEYDRTILEAKMVAQRILEMTGKKQTAPLYVLEEDGSSYRKAQYKDIVILFRSMKHTADVFVKVLSDAGIPVASELSCGLFATQEIKTLLSCLWVIHNPYIDIELAALLHSPMFAFTSKDLAQIRIQAEKKWREAGTKDRHLLYDAVCLSEDEKVRCFLSVLSKWQDQSRFMDVGSLLWEIINETGYLNYLQALEGGDRRVANVCYLVDCARAYAKTGKYTVYEFLQYVSGMKDAKLDFGEANVHGEHDNIVRIMSMHKSKGLEFPIVFVSGLGRQFNQMDAKERVLVHADDFLAADYAAAKTREKRNSFMHKAFAENMKTENIAEEFRVFYVALTRAKEKLILTGAAKDFHGMIEGYAKVAAVGEMALPFGYRRSAKTYLDWTVMSLIRNPKFHRLVTQELADMGVMRRCDYCLSECVLPASYDLTLSVYREEDFILQEAAEKTDHLLSVASYRKLQQQAGESFMSETLNRRLSYRYPYAAYASKKAKYSVTELKAAGGDGSMPLKTDEMTSWPEQEERQAPPVHTVPQFMQKTVALDGANRGTLIHRILQMLDFTRCSDKAMIQTQLTQWVIEGVLPADVMEHVDISELCAFFESDLGMQMRSADADNRLYKEKQFTILVPMSELDDEAEKNSDEMILVQGIIDAYFINSEGDIVVVDYKTDRGVLPMEQYKKQLTYYARTLEKLTHKRVAACYVYALTKKKAIPIER